MANRYCWLSIGLLAAAACGAHAAPACKTPPGTAPFEFKSGRNTLRGFVDRPASAGKHPVILIVHGSGSTDVTHGDGGYNSSYDELRAAFRRSGFATVIWDNAGNAPYRINQQARDYVVRADTYLRELHRPTLAIFGDQDIQVDWRTSVRIYRESFALAGNRGLTIKVFEGAGHNLYRASSSRFVDGYVELMVEWLRANAGR